jgi:phage tail sheath protein FI
MPEYLSPGVYTEEVPSGPRPIQGVGTSTAGFVGQTERGPTTPRLVTSIGDYERWFGGAIDPARSFLPFAVRGFFDNEGRRAFIARVVGTDPNQPARPAGRNHPTQVAGQAVANNFLRFQAIGDGAWGNRILVYIRDASQAAPGQDWFRITLLYYRDAIPTPFVDPLDAANFGNPARREPDVLEDYDDLSADPAAPNYVIRRVNNNSRLVELDFVNTAQGGVPAPNRPANAGGAAGRARATLATQDGNTTLVASAVGPGIWANGFSVVIAPGQNGTFSVEIQDGNNQQLELFDGFADADPQEAVAVVNAGSGIVRLAWQPEGAQPSRPDDGAVALADGADTGLTNGSDGANATAAAYLGDPARPPDQRTGLAGLATIDEISLLVAPDAENTNVPNRFQITNAVVNQCERLRDRFAILSTPEGEGNVQALRKPRDSTYAAVYFPWVRVVDPRTQQTLLVPPDGHVAGIFARSDRNRGVHKAPANEVVRGIVNRDLSPVIRPLQFHVSAGEHDVLNPRGINVIRDFRADGRGIRLWGARTLSSDPLWVYVNVRRIFLFVRESVDEGTQWVVFEPNDETTWARVRQTVGNFLLTVWRSGALRGLTEEEAFFVRCDRTTMSEADIDAGRLICEVGIAPVKPAEFVIFRFQQKMLLQTA